MLRWILLAINCYCLIADDYFEVISCNDDDGRPELKFTVDKDFFEQNLNWQADKDCFEMCKIFRLSSVFKNNISSYKQLTTTK